MGLGQVGEPVDNQRVQVKQAGLDTKDCRAASSARGFETQVLSHLLESHFDVPAADKRFDDALNIHANLRAEEVFFLTVSGQFPHVN